MLEALGACDIVPSYGLIRLFGSEVEAFCRAEALNLEPGKLMVSAGLLFVFGLKGVLSVLKAPFLILKGALQLPEKGPPKPIPRGLEYRISAKTQVTSMPKTETTCLGP